MAKKIVVMNHITGRVDVFDSGCEEGYDIDKYLRELGYDVDNCEYMVGAQVYDDRRKETLEQEIHNLKAEIASLKTINKQHDESEDYYCQSLDNACRLLFEFRDENEDVESFLKENMSTSEYVQAILDNSDLTGNDIDFIMEHID